MGKGIGMQIADDYDLKVVDGETQIGDIQAQSQALIIICNPGEWKQRPELGVGVESWLMDDNPQDLSAEVKRQLKSDDFNVESVVLVDGEIVIDAEY